MVKFSVGYQAIVAIILGIGAGLFFGPLCTILDPIGVAFIMLLQMVVLPYIPTLLMHGLGSLSPEIAKKLFKRGWFFLILLWAIVFAAIYTLKILIPTPLPTPSGDFSLEKSHSTHNFLSYIIPQNPFYDLVHNVVPAIAFFSLVFGTAIMHLKQKEPLLSLLERTNSSLEKILKWIASISPIGIFAHIAVVMGTVDFTDLYKLELYVVMFILTCLFLSIWVLPMIVSSLSSIPYRELIQEYRIVCILAFATGIPSIAFPFINNCMRRLAEKKNLDLATFRSTSQTVIPLAYSFAQIGNLFLLLFIFFMAFYYRHPLKPNELLFLPFLSIPISFGTPQLSISGISFLVDNLNYPREAFRLFVETSAINLNFQVLLSVSGMLTFIILVLLRYYGLLEINWWRLSKQACAMVFTLFAAVFIGTKFVNVEDNYRDLYYKLRMENVFPNPPEVTLYRERAPKAPTPKVETLSRVLRTGILRVGYNVTNIPFCYLNDWDEVVGYDIAYAYKLAKDLDVKLELIPLDINNIASDMDSGYIDIGMSAILVTENRVETVDFSHSYMQQPNAVVVPALKVNQYLNLTKLQEDPNFKIGGIGGHFSVAERHFPCAKLVPITSMKELREGKVDAVMWSELPAYVWCLTHPEFTTLSFNNQLGIRYFAYPMKQGSADMIQFVNEWMTLKEAEGFKKQQEAYWIHGKKSISTHPRWSIIRDVLHWVN